jgi:hypothetical protein
MKVMIRALHAEKLKLRSTLALWLCVLAPLVVALFGTAMIWSNPFMLTNAAPETRWQVVIDTVMGTWAMMMLPLLVTLEAALLAGLEHGNHQWKHLLALPVPRSTHYLAKLIALIGLVGLATLLLCVLIPVGGFLVMLAPDTLLVGSPPWSHLLGRALATSAAALLMLAVQMFIAIRWRSFTVTMAAGITATMIAMFIPKGGLFNELFPWAMPTLAINGTHDQLTAAVMLGIVGFCAVAALGVWDFNRREHQ